MNVLRTPFKDLALHRYPPSADRSLRAWDAADELLLKHVHEHQNNGLPASARVLICNDSHGALACALHHVAPVSWSDSSLAHTALVKNWTANSLSGQPTKLSSLSKPEGVFDLVLIKVPKSQALLEHQLAKLRPHLTEKTVVIAASLVRHLYRSAFTLFEKYLGAVTTSLAVKKARLVFCQVDTKPTEHASPFPDSYHDEQLGMTLTNHANVFCRDRLDIGARVFISHTHQLTQQMSDSLSNGARIIDLACGNGVLGIHVQRQQPGAQLTFIDESYMAVDSARMNHQTLCGENSPSGIFDVANGLENCENNSADLILCNPPFHAQHAVAQDSAHEFIQQAARVLAPHGALWLVANNHLPYKRVMNRHFKQCATVANTSGFIVYSATHAV